MPGGEQTGLTSLPDHLLLDIVDYLDTARDVSRFSQASRCTHSLMCSRGWESFARTRFLSLKVPSVDARTHPWRTVVDRMTYLDRCWEKRSFVFTSFREREHIPRPHRRRWGEQSVNFEVLVSALTAPASPPYSEILACAAGENLLLRLRHGGGSHEDEWVRLAGRDSGYLPGTGDITALSLIERNMRPEIIVGRADGSVRLLSAQMGDAVGRPLSELLPPAGHSHSFPTSPGRQAITWTECHPAARVVASCRDSFLTLHSLEDVQIDCHESAYEAKLKPIACYDAAGVDQEGDRPFVCCAKFTGADDLACAVSGSSMPLRLGKLRPTGLDMFDSNLSHASSSEPQTVRALESVGGRAHESLLLSAWGDGTYRLVDLRTPSAHDAMYRDHEQPYDAGSSLLVYGMQRFVAGGNAEAILRLFDFRHPKPYHQTAAMACSNTLPEPMLPAAWAHVRDPPYPEWRPPSASQCEPAKGIVCLWHDQARQQRWRADGSILLGTDRHDRVSSLAKASDLSDAFYCGLRGVVVETGMLDEVDARDPRSIAEPPGWCAEVGVDGFRRISLLESGIDFSGLSMHVYSGAMPCQEYERKDRLNWRWRPIKMHCSRGSETGGARRV
ncbi:hypothetical protein XA68_10687 [Ophiocordyceps unilateralis]|uniref:F-box domain-containing protein n=1 Tax=Ophiocordyceps unilateralis TaxID=268505 RepID=A0A2A9PIF1_OPHUN|nr:hypothetical protein XA68_10687 [Ophiocordyceps unilateralis]